MTPKEKALELVNKFSDYAHTEDYSEAPMSFEEMDKNSKESNEFNSQQCALIAVNEIIEVAYWNSVKEYWKEVKQEIEKL